MTLEYVKHNRPVTTDHLNRYGKLATHDIHVPILVAYELGKTKDKNGIPVDINADFINHTQKISNAAIKKKFNSPFAKIKSFAADIIGDYEIIPIIKNHKTDDVDNLVGHTKGLFYTEKIDGVLALMIKGVIKDPEAKTKIEGDIFRNTSFGTRPDGSIKEISIVSNEAIPHGGLIMAEESSAQNGTELQLSEKELQLAEEIRGLQFQEAELENTIIPNHLILSKLIKTGRILPFQYENLINTTNREALEIIEKITPARDLGLMLGTRREPEKIKTEEIKNKEFKQKLANTKKKHGIKTTDVDNKESPKQEIPVQFTEMIRQNQSFDDVRTIELKHILELAEHSPDIAAKYIRIELGEEIEQPKYNDKLLHKYLANLSQIKQKLNTLQLGE